MSIEKLNWIERVILFFVKKKYEKKTVVMEYLAVIICVLLGSLICRVFSYRTAFEDINNLILIIVDNKDWAFNFTIVVNSIWEFLKLTVPAFFFIRLIEPEKAITFLTVVFFVASSVLYLGSVKFSYGGVGSMGEKSKSKNIDKIESKCTKSVDRAFQIAEDYKNKSLYRGKLSAERGNEYARLTRIAQQKESECEGKVNAALVYNANINNGGHGDIEFAKNFVIYGDIFSILAAFFFAMIGRKYAVEMGVIDETETDETGANKQRKQTAKRGAKNTKTKRTKRAKQTTKPNETERLQTLVLERLRGVSNSFGDVDVSSVSKMHNTYYKRYQQKGSKDNLIKSGCLAFVLREMGEKVKHTHALDYVIETFTK